VADIQIHNTQPGDVELLVTNIRAADAAEIEACGQEPLSGLRHSVARSLLCWSAFADGKLACILGCSPVSMLEGIGSPWMIGTPVLDAHSRVLVRLTPAYIVQMQTAFPHLVNHVHAANATSVRWLKRIGFTLDAAEPFGPKGEAFHRFEMRA